MSDLAEKYSISTPYLWMDMIRPADRVNLAKDAKRLANEVLALRADLAAAREELEKYKAIASRLVAWDKKWPKGTIFSYGRMEDCHGELDSCVDQLVKLAQPTTQGERG